MLICGTGIGKDFVVQTLGGWYNFEDIDSSVMPIENLVKLIEMASALNGSVMISDDKILREELLKRDIPYIYMFHEGDTLENGVLPHETIAVLKPSEYLYHWLKREFSLSVPECKQYTRTSKEIYLNDKKFVYSRLTAEEHSEA